MRNKKYFGYIYKTINLLSKKIYIGQRKGKFDSSYFGSGKLIKQALKKYGEINFSVKLLSTGVSRSNLNFLEIKFIKEYREYLGRENLYNLSDGGYQRNSGYSHSEEAREKMRQSRLGKIPWMKGKHHTEKAKRALSKANKGIKPSLEIRLKLSISNTGRKHTEETKKRISLSHRGKIFTKEHRRNISLNHKGMLGKKNSEETKKKMSIARFLYWERKRAERVLI